MNLLISVTKSLSSLGTVMITRKFFVLGFDLSCVTLFDELGREELQFIPGYESSMYRGVKDLGVIGIFGVPVIVTIGVPHCCSGGYWCCCPWGSW